MKEKGHRITKVLPGSIAEELEIAVDDILLEINGKEVLVSFRDSYWKGIHSASFRINGIKQNVKIKGAYPGFIRRIQEVVIIIKVCLMHAVNRITKRIC